MLTSHHCRRHYKVDESEKLFTCDRCKMMGCGERYICSRCDNAVHKQCRYQKSVITHGSFPGSSFKFLKKPFTEGKQYSKCCNACGEHIRGVSYHCKEDDFNLHPFCSKLQEKLLADTSIFNLIRSKPSSKCLWCKNRKISDGNGDVPGWSYVSKCNKYNFHVYCMMEMVHEASLMSGKMAPEEALKGVVKSKKSGIVWIAFGTLPAFLKMVVAVVLAILRGVNGY